jgi:hypothetical protein
MPTPTEILVFLFTIAVLLDLADKYQQSSKRFDDPQLDVPVEGDER